MKTLISIIFILILSFFAIKPLTIPGFFPIHDDTQVSRVYEMEKALSDGMFPVRWSQDLGYGYGYPLFNFYAPLSYYAGGFFTSLGFDALESTKIVMALGLILASLFMYLLAREFWGHKGGIISSLLYLYAPYSAVNIYVRGNIAESWGYAFLPLFFYGVVKIYRNQNPYFVLVSALGLTGIILSHNLTALITAIFLVPTVIFILFSKNKRILLFFSASIVLGFLLSSFYFIPALLEMNYTNVSSQVGGGADFRNHFVCIGQLWEANWGFGGSAPGCLDGMSFKIGKLHLILFFLFIFTLFKNKIRDRLTILFSCFFVLSVFLMLEMSKPIWEAVVPMAFIQYPWRFLVFTSFSLSFIGGGSIFLVKFLPKNIFPHAALEYLILISVAIIILYSKLFVPQTILPKSANDYTSEKILTTKISKISDEYLPKNFQKNNIKEGSRVELVKGEGKLRNVAVRTNSIKLEAESKTSSSVYFKVAYFPAWKAYVNDKETKVIQEDNGLIINVPGGTSSVELKYVETPIERAANLATLTGLVMFILGTIYCIRRNDKESSAA